MKNSAAGVHLKAGSTEFPLASDINAFCDLEAEFGEGVNRIIKRFSDPADLRMTDVRRYLRVMLRSNDKPMEEQHAHDVCASAGIAACNDAVTTHLLALFSKG